MINPWQILKTEKELNEKVIQVFTETYGKRGSDAISAVMNGQVKKYKDYFVVVGNSGEYYIEGGFCSCDAQKYGKECWHTLAVRIAEELLMYESYDLWYYKNGVDEDEPEYER